MTSYTQTRKGFRVALVDYDSPHFDVNAIQDRLSAFLTLAAKRMPDPGPLARAGIIFLIICFCLMTPITFGFAAMTFVTFAAGRPSVLVILWKGILFFGFLWFWFHSD